MMNTNKTLKQSANNASRTIKAMSFVQIRKLYRNDADYYTYKLENKVYA